MGHALAELVDVPRLQELTDRLYQAFGVPSAIVSTDGQVLTRSGWQRICTEFHRARPQIEQECIASETAIRAKLEAGEPCAIDTCPRGLTEASVPIVVAGGHLANALVGQLLLEPLDRAGERRFREQARRLGIDEEAYVEALREVPVLSRERLRSILFFLGRLAAAIADQGMRRLRAQEGRARTWDAGDVFRAAFEHAGDCVLLLEPGPAGLTVVEINQAALRAYGYSREELVGRPITLIDPCTTPELFAERLRSLERGMPLTFDVRRRRKDGSFFEAEVKRTTLELGSRSLILSVERDVTERKRTEAALSHFHRLMSYVISHARSAIAVHDRDMKYVYVSDRYLEEYEVEKHDVIGRHHYDVFPDLPQKWRDVHQRALKGEVCSAEEDPYVHDDGSVDWTRWECRPWYEADGSIGGIIVYTEVITERKRLEDERKALESQLQQAMKMEAVGRLAGGVAHDFNNLLTGIMGNVELALMDLAPGDRLAGPLHEIAAAAESAASLTRQLLAFSRKQLIEPKVLSLNDLIGRLHKMLTRLIGEDVRLRTVPADGLDPVKVDPGQFEQVLVNLAVNARDAMPDGGQLLIETANVVLDEDYCARHALATPGHYVMLAVSDTGHGMPEEVKAHLFEPFFTTKPTGRGTGLGLATIFGAVKQAGGSVEVYSEVGRGTSFKIYLPRFEGEVQALDRDSAEREQPRGNETVLLVEDNDGVRAVATRILTRLGYRVTPAANGEQALALAETQTSGIDLLITDVVMPGMNGRDLGERVTRTHPETRVLFASGYTENVIVHHGVVDERLHFIAKPYTAKALANKVREVLDTAPKSG